MPLQGELINSCVEYSNSPFHGKDSESGIEDSTYGSAVGCLSQIIALSTIAKETFANLANEVDITTEKLQSLTQRVKDVERMVGDIVTQAGYPQTLDSNARYSKDTYARSDRHSELLLEMTSKPAHLANRYSKIKPAPPLKDLYAGITAHPRYQNPARRYTHPGYSTQAWMESHKVSTRDATRLREAAAVDRSTRRTKFKGERQKFLQRVRKIEDKYAASPSFSPGKKLKLDAWRDSIQKVNTNVLADLPEQESRGRSHSLINRGRGNSYADLVRRQVELDRGRSGNADEARVLAELGQDDADEYLEAYSRATDQLINPPDRTGDVFDSVSEKGSYSPQRAPNALYTKPSDRYSFAAGSENSDDDVEVVDEVDDDGAEVADETAVCAEKAVDSDDEDDCEVVNEAVTCVEKAVDSDDEDDCEVVDEVEQVEEVGDTSAPAPAAVTNVADESDDCIVVEETKDEGDHQDINDQVTHLASNVSALSLNESTPLVEDKTEQNGPVEVQKEVAGPDKKEEDKAVVEEEQQQQQEEEEEEDSSTVVTYRLQCAGVKVAIRSAANPHADILRYIYSGTRIRVYPQMIGGYFQLASGGGFVNRFTKKTEWIEERN